MLNIANAMRKNFENMKYNVHSTASPEAQKAISYDYIVDVTNKQKYLLPVETLYGDGSRFYPLTLRGFQEIYNQIDRMIHNIDSSSKGDNNGNSF